MLTDFVLLSVRPYAWGVSGSCPALSTNVVRKLSVSGICPVLNRTDNPPYGGSGLSDRGDFA